MHTLRATVIALSLALACSSLSACGSKSDIGEPCSKSGTQDDCVDGAICDTEAGQVICLKRCSADTDCNVATEACTGVSGGTGKACHRK